jgi:hypothetical protein
MHWGQTGPPAPLAHLIKSHYRRRLLAEVWGMVQPFRGRDPRTLTCSLRTTTRDCSTLVGAGLKTEPLAWPLGPSFCTRLTCEASACLYWLARRPVLSSDCGRHPKLSCHVPPQVRDTTGFCAFAVSAWLLGCEHAAQCTRRWGWPNPYISGCI